MDAPSVWFIDGWSVLAVPGARQDRLTHTYGPGVRCRRSAKAPRLRVNHQVTAIGPPFDPVAPLIGAGEKM